MRLADSPFFYIKFLLTLKMRTAQSRMNSLGAEGSHSTGGDFIGTAYPRIVTGGSDRVVALWDPRQRSPGVFKFKGHTDTVNCLLLDSSRACVVSGGRDQTVKVSFDDATMLQSQSQSLSPLTQSQRQSQCQCGFTSASTTFLLPPPLRSGTSEQAE